MRSAQIGMCKTKVLQMTPVVHTDIPEMEPFS